MDMYIIWLHHITRWARGMWQGARAARWQGQGEVRSLQNSGIGHWQHGHHDVATRHGDMVAERHHGGWRSVTGISAWPGIAAWQSIAEEYAK